MVYQAKSSELERKIQEREIQSQKMEEQRANAEAEMNKLESELSLQLEEKMELVRIGLTVRNGQVWQ